MNKSIAKNFLSRSPFVRAILIAVTLLAIGLAQSAKANTITYTYTGNPFSYVGTGPDVTHVSGGFTVASPLAPSTTQALAPYTVGGTITGYDFTDGRTTWDISNYVVDPNSQFSITTGATGAITAWCLSIYSPIGIIDTLAVASCAPTGGFTASDGTNLYSNYDAYNFNDPGTWTESGTAGVPEPTTIGLAALGGAILLLARRRKQQNHMATRTDRTPPAHH